ncbi:F-type conjugal transfer protein TrbF (plasmid) [Escherichia coli]|nr:MULTISPECIES: F-type conjugal transfer protein TrbF [Enterobacteriaceae]EFH8469501.1 conjugal transfer protein TrbF [Escherichia coli]MDS1451019.1 F-type conjugal transfer protein TrbF [Escherichia coli]MDS1455559.1 F-type conjugal transfer protein TrbF [Escherichia coli]MDS1460972.1 F-type conjugal transfer protein TrbF [Escherichia coli]MDS1461082.1 F-type conjugal transfer protein TrbF [Escherichia coli]
MTENKKNQEFKIRKIKRDIERGCDNAEKYFWLFVVFFVAGLLLWHGMHAIFSAGIDSWKANPELNNLIYMWNILMYAIPYTLYALAAGFLVTFFSVPNVRINIREYHDIPAETPYAPGEQIKGGQ